MVYTYSKAGDFDSIIGLHPRKDGKLETSPSCYYKQIGGYRGGTLFFFN